MDNKTLYSVLLDVKSLLGSHTAILESQNKKLDSIETQAIKTNGRVTSLEATQATLAKVSSQNSGIIVDIQDRLKKEEESGERQGVEINRLTKSDSERTEFSTKTKLMELDTKEKLKLSFYAMLIGSIGAAIAKFFEFASNLSN